MKKVTVDMGDFKLQSLILKQNRAKILGVFVENHCLLNNCPIMKGNNENVRELNSSRTLTVRASNQFKEKKPEHFSYLSNYFGVMLNGFCKSI